MKILAIDIGTSQIKSVVVEARWKKYDVVSQEFIPVDDSLSVAPSPEQLLTPGQIRVLEVLAKKHATGINRVVSNLPLSIYSSRMMSFPFKDKRKVTNAVNFALEDEIPFDLESCVVTSHIFPAKGKETSVLTGFSPLAPLDSFVASLEAIHMNVDCLMMEDCAYAAQFQKVKGEKFKNIAVLNLGHRRSGMFFFHDGIPVLHKTTMVGGFHITENISKHYSVNLPEAEMVKIDRGFFAVPGMELSADQTLFSDRIRDSLEPVFADFQQGLMAFTSRFSEGVDIVYLTGGSSLFPGLIEYLSARWQKRIAHLQVKHLFPQLSIQPEKSAEISLSLATALGFSQIKGEDKIHINFRSGKLISKKSILNLNFHQFIYPAKLLLSVYFIVMFSLIGQSILLKKDLANKDELVERNLKSVLGSGSSSYLATLRADPKKMQREIDKKLSEMQKSSSGAKSSSSISLDLIRDLSKSLPRETIVEVKQMEYNSQATTMDFEAPSQGDAERAIDTLTKLPMISMPKASPIEAAKGTRKKFSFSFQPNKKKAGG